MKNQYEDIIHLPHPVSKKHPQMPIGDRAAQFSPFAALTGYDSAIRETARLTSEKIELDENAKTELDMKLSLLREKLEQQPEIAVTYFMQDEKKAGGGYVTERGRLKKIDAINRCLVLEQGRKIPIDDILELDA